MKKIGIVTSTRADFGLLLPVITALRRYEKEGIRVELVVTGTHLSDKYGYTVTEIENSNVRIDVRVAIPVESANAMDISKNQAETLQKFTKLFMEKMYDGIVILGDRYEMLAIAIAAGNTHTPIFHMCGGDTTEGAIDEWIRHAITKMSYLHFPTNKESYKRVIQLGEDPDRVFNYGSTSIDNILNAASLNREDALKSIDIYDNGKYALCTYHPVTMEKENIKEKIADFLNAVTAFPEIKFIVTKANSDQGGEYINHLLEQAEEYIPNLYLYSSLGIVRYLSLMKYSEFVLGNSSSGIIETPAFGIPTVNIGDRQKGRLQSESVINCDCDTKSIINAINLAMGSEFKEKSRNVISPYGDGKTGKRIAKKIIEITQKGKINLKKKFYMIDAQV